MPTDREKLDALNTSKKELLGYLRLEGLVDANASVRECGAQGLFSVEFAENNYVFTYAGVSYKLFFDLLVSNDSMVMRTCRLDSITEEYKPIPKMSAVLVLDKNLSVAVRFFGVVHDTGYNWFVWAYIEHFINTVKEIDARNLRDWTDTESDGN